MFKVLSLEDEVGFGEDIFGYCRREGFVGQAEELFVRRILKGGEHALDLRLKSVHTICVQYSQI